MDGKSNDVKSGMADVIKDLRQMTGLSQAKFAAKFSISLSNIQHWEQGVSSPPEYVVGMMKELLYMERMLRETKDFDSVADYMRVLRQEVHDKVLLRDRAIALLHALATKYTFESKYASGSDKSPCIFSDDEILGLLDVNIEDLQEDVTAAFSYISSHPYAVRTDDGREIHSMWVSTFSYTKDKGFEVFPNTSLHDVFSWISASPEPEHGLSEYL